MSQAEVEVEDEVDNEELDDSNVVYEIHTSGADFDVDGLVKRFDRGDIYRPSFQGVSETLCMRLSPCRFDGSFVEPFWV